MFAVVKTGGKQYKAVIGETLTVEKLAGEPGEIISLDAVMMIVDGAATTLGSPLVEGAAIAGEIVEQARGPKVIAFKKRRRKNSKRKRGHRQDLTVLRVTEILTGGASPKAAKAEPAPAAEAGAVSDDIELIAGIGPTLKKKLVAAGVTSWKQIAAWTEADLEKWDAELALRGRATREEWVEQAKELLAGKPPRAKVDQAKAESGE